jgi:hypothetical protein
MRVDQRVLRAIRHDDRAAVQTNAYKQVGTGRISETALMLS